MRFCVRHGLLFCMISGRLFVAFSAFAIMGWSQPSAGVAGPVTGFIFDAPSGAIRPMLGIPGAAYLGKVVATGLTAASVAPDGSAALAVQPDGRLVLYSGLRTVAPATLAIPGALSGVDHFAWAADSTAAAVYAAHSGQAQIITGFAQSPSAGAAIDLSTLPGLVTAVAFDGQRLIFGVVSAGSGGIYVASARSATQRIAVVPSPSAIALAGTSLFFADNQSQQIWQVQSYAGSPAVVLFANDSSINSPAGLQVSADGLRLYVANAGSRKLAVYDIAARSPLQSLDLAFVPTGLDLFGDRSVFLLNASGPGPRYVAKDAGASKAAVFFVPAPANRRPLKAPIRPI